LSPLVGGLGGHGVLNYELGMKLRELRLRRCEVVLCFNQSLVSSWQGFMGLIGWY
jgi:hypothetical protein